MSEAAREYEEARAVKRKFEEVQVITGEEEESNVLQVSAIFYPSQFYRIQRHQGADTTTTKSNAIIRVN